MAVRILVDSAAELSKEFCKENNIELLPIYLNFGEEEFISDFTISNKEFYEKLAVAKVMPKTTLINEYRFSEIFNDVKNKGDEMVVIIMSKHLSGTFNAAMTALKNVDYKNIFIPDHLTITVAQTALALEALKMRDNGKRAKEICEEIMELKDKIKLYAAVSTLKFLKEGGRLSGTAAFVGTLLNIKPIIALEDGKIYNHQKCIGNRQARKALIECIKNDGLDDSMPVYFGHTNNEKDANDFIKDLESHMHFKNGGTYGIGSIVGTHAGPGAVAVIFFKK